MSEMPIVNDNLAIRFSKVEAELLIARIDDPTGLDIPTDECREALERVKQKLKDRPRALSLTKAERYALWAFSYGFRSNIRKTELNSELWAIMEKIDDKLWAEA